MSAGVSALTISGSQVIMRGKGEGGDKDWGGGKGLGSASLQLPRPARYDQSDESLPRKWEKKEKTWLLEKPYDLYVKK